MEVSAHDVPIHDLDEPALTPEAAADLGVTELLIRYARLALDLRKAEQHLASYETLVQEQHRALSSIGAGSPYAHMVADYPDAEDLRRMHRQLNDMQIETFRLRAHMRPLEIVLEG